VSAFTGMQQELDKERRAMERIWSRRQQEIGRVVTNTVGLYGDLQGIIGASLPTIPSLNCWSPRRGARSAGEHRRCRSSETAKLLHCNQGLFLFSNFYINNPSSTYKYGGTKQAETGER